MTAESFLNAEHLTAIDQGTKQQQKAPDPNGRGFLLEHSWGNEIVSLT
jgi:hypothetical protein